MKCPQALRVLSWFTAKDAKGATGTKEEGQTQYGSCGFFLPRFGCAFARAYGVRKKFSVLVPGTSATPMHDNRVHWDPGPSPATRYSVRFSLSGGLGAICWSTVSRFQTTLLCDGNVELDVYFHSLQPQVVDVPLTRGFTIDDADRVRVLTQRCCMCVSVYVDLTNCRNRENRIWILVQVRVIEPRPIPRTQPCRPASLLR